ncbi:S41 family peptidase [Inhella gelatinilytica]|uniref:Tricorn protease homolog n=1 Tax=Inhella gelatinilytica TaxID=2795030 RepID=A0A931IU38_9BURK|nr:S41 family peptidase [Inhella gelatinilytica]MBH9552174.1 PD40 domain-containing protein [Inhella gelatinilytica]
MSLPHWVRWSALGAGLLGAGLTQAGSLGFYRQPTVAGDTVVFVSQGDLWRVTLGGGAAQRLTSHAGQEQSPVLLPDGKTVAFVAQYESAGDVYTLSLAGGVPQRRTWLGLPTVRVWSADASGALLVTAPAEDGRPVQQPYRLVGDQLQALPAGDASDAAVSLDGKRLLFTRHGLRGDHAKNYRGGAVAGIWSVELHGTAEAKPLLGADFPRANNRRPLPYRDEQGRERIAFLSDRDGFFNVWSVGADGQGARQHTRFKDFDARHLALSGSTGVVARGADLQRVDLNAGGGDAPVLPIGLAGDQPASTTRWIQKPQSFLTEAAVAPNGERALLSVRGRLATQGVQNLRRAVLPMPEGARCRDAAFSADSKSVFALCDLPAAPQADGAQRGQAEVELWQFDALGLTAPKVLTRDAKVLRTELSVAPDGRHIAHADLGGAVYLTDLKADGGPRTQKIDQLSDDNGIEFAWHPEAQALAYSRRPVTGGIRSQVWLYTLADGDKRVLTSPKYSSSSPAFSPDGQWLYFASRRHFQLQPGSSVWAERDMGPAFEPGTKLYALALQPGLRSPFAAKDELPGVPKPEPKKDEKPDAKSDPKKDAKVALPRIDREGLAERLHELPLPAGRFRSLQAEAKRLWWIESDGASGALRSVSLEAGAQADMHSDKVRRFQLSGNGKTLLVQREAAPGQAGDLLLLDAAPKAPADTSKFAVRWSDWQIPVNPRQEWRQMFMDAWRLQRDYFYDAQLHGVDWAASRDRHVPLLERVGDRVELGELMGMMASDLSLLHSQVGLGDVPAAADPAPAMAGLGARLVSHAKGASLARIYRTEAELVSERGPLQAPGLDLREGDVITAINGQALQWPQGAVLLQGEAGKQVRLEVQRADGTGARSVIVTPVDARREAALRYQDWRTRRAEAVDRLSGGRVGYLHLRAMGGQDIADFAREFYAQLDKEAIVLDVRFNNGGNIDSWVLDKLLRKSWAYWQPRHPAGGPRQANMQQSFAGKLAMLINENSYSDGETVAEGFKRLGLGAVIGKTTSGAGVWLTDRNTLLDNGIVRAAEIAQMSPHGEVLIEGKGVVPDLEVDNPPRATAQGQDAQLEAAVQHLLKQLPAKATAMEERLPRVKAYPRPRD